MVTGGGFEAGFGGQKRSTVLAVTNGHQIDVAGGEGQEIPSVSKQSPRSSVIFQAPDERPIPYHVLPSCPCEAPIGRFIGSQCRENVDPRFPLPALSNLDERVFWACAPLIPRRSKLWMARKVCATPRDCAWKHGKTRRRMTGDRKIE